MTTEEKLSYLTEKLAAKEKALAECGEKKANIKQLEKRLKAEVAVLKEEVRGARLEDLGDFLQQSGVAFDEVREAVNSGLFNKLETSSNNESETAAQADSENVSQMMPASSVTQKDEGNEVV